MNKIFRIVFNAATGRYVVASEMAKGRTKAAAHTLPVSFLLGATLVSGAAMANNTQLGGGTATGADANATGWETYAKGINSTVVGNQVTAEATGSIAIQGNNNNTVAVDAASTNGIAIGSESKVINAVDGVALGADAKVTAASSVALGADSVADRANTVSIGSSTLKRQLVNVANGTLDNDAVNVWQLKGLAAAFGGGATVNADGTIGLPTYALTKANAITGSSGAATDVGTGFGKVDAALGALDTRVTNNANDISSLQTTVNNISSGTVGLVQQSAAGQKLTVGKATDGAAVDFTGTAGTRKLQGVSEGDISATSKEAINGSQLYTTNQNVAQNTADIDTLKGRADATDAAVAQNTSDIARNTSDIAKNTTDIAKNTSDIAKNTTDIAKNTSDIADLQTRTTANESAITQNTSDIARNTSDIAALDSRTTKNEGDISNLDSRVTNVEGDVSNLSQQISNGEVGLVKQDATSRVITVAADKDGTEVNIAGTQGERKLGGVADGEVSATSKQAVNGSQLNATNERVAANESAIAGVDARTTKNEGDIANLDQRQTKTEGDVTNLRSDVTTIDGRVTNVESNVASLNQRMVQGNTEVLQQSRSYTDSRFDALHGEMDDRFNVQDQRIDSMGAMSSAMSMMSASLAGLHTQDRAAVGTGVVNGEVALSVGYQHAISDSANFTLGGAFTQEDQSVGAAVGFGW